MGKGFLFLIAFIIAEFALFGQSTNVSIKQLRTHAYVLSSDSLQGRATGTIGQKKAANYLMSEFNKYGLTKTPNNSYKHNYNLIRKHNNFISVKNNRAILFSPWHFFFVSGYNQNDTINTELLFAGYGTNKELDSLQINDNAVAFIAYSPQDAYKTINRIKTEYNTNNFFVIIPKENKEIDRAWKTNYLLSKYKLPNIYERDKKLQINENWATPADSVNIFYCFNNALRNILGKTDAELINIASENNITTATICIKSNIECRINCNDSVEMINVENIAGLVYGKNKNQTIVVSAHYDHLGTEMGEIYYGADDNASGTSVMLELARLISEQNKIEPLERSVLFLGFSGEEMGLYGSEAYINFPIIPLDSTILNINMDMVGRCDKKHSNNQNYMYLLNAGLGEKKYFHLAKKGLNIPKNFTVSRNPGSYEKEMFKRGSDHYSFYKKEVPISVAFTGLHDDYHTPADTPNKLNYGNMVNITNILFQYILEIANNPKEYPVRLKK